MLPGEAAALRRANEGSWRRWSMVAFVALLIAVFPLLLYILSGDGHLDHLRGRAEPLTAQVESVRVDGYCRQPSHDKFRAELSWTAGGVPGHGSYSFCQKEPEVGETIQVWIGPSGHVEIDSPSEYRVGLISIGLVLGALGGSLGAALVIGPRRRRRRLLGVDGASLSSAGPVELVRARRGGKSRFRMRATASAPESVAHDVNVVPVLFTRDGTLVTTRTPREAVGSWRLHVGGSADDRRRVGLLVRGHERCWVEIPVRREGSKRRRSTPDR